MCQLTSLAMVMNAMGIKRKRSDCQFEDELYNIANLAGYGGSSLWENTWDVYEKVLKNYEDGYVFKGISKNNGIVSNIIKGIGNGIPLLLSIDYKEDGNHGHVTVAVGYTEKGIIVNDLYGNLNSGTTYSAHDIDKGDGAFEEYDKTRWFIGDKYVKDSPGFAPKWIKGSWSINPENNGYAAVNGFFNQLYSHIGSKYHHEGIDFRGPDKTEIVSFINAKVIAYGWMTDSKGSIYGSGYGQTIFLYNLNGKGIYQLSHLSAYDKNIYVGKQYCPGNIVAYVGNSGHGLINDKEHWAPHLHLSYYDVSYDKNYEKFVYREGNVIKRNNKQFNDIWNKLRNPFDHDSTEKHGGFN